MEINIGKTRLTSFPNVTADRLPRLRDIRINGNKIRQIPAVSYDAISDDLEILHLEENGLLTVPDLSSKPKLHDIMLHGNHLETIPDLLNLSLTQLTLVDNPIKCDQRMCWWKMWHRIKDRPANTDDFICAAPPELAGIAFADVNPRDMHCFKGIYIIHTSCYWIGNKTHCICCLYQNYVGFELYTV